MTTIITAKAKIKRVLDKFNTEKPDVCSWIMSFVYSSINKVLNRISYKPCAYCTRSVLRMTDDICGCAEHRRPSNIRSDNYFSSDKGNCRGIRKLMLIPQRYRNGKIAERVNRILGKLNIDKLLDACRMIKKFSCSSLNKVLTLISLKPCTCCGHPVPRLVGHICVCSESCYDALRNAETESKLIIS